jgi:hypothetical protein
VSFRYRIVDSTGTELEIASYPTLSIGPGETVYISGGRDVKVLEVRDESGQEGDVQATLVVEG